MLELIFSYAQKKKTVTKWTDLYEESTLQKCTHS